MGLMLLTRWRLCPPSHPARGGAFCCSELLPGEALLPCSGGGQGSSSQVKGSAGREASELEFQEARGGDSGMARVTPAFPQGQPLDGHLCSLLEVAVGAEFPMLGKLRRFLPMPGAGSFDPFALSGPPDEGLSGWRAWISHLWATDSGPTSPCGVCTPWWQVDVAAVAVRAGVWGLSLAWARSRSLRALSWAGGGDGSACAAPGGCGSQDCTGHLERTRRARVSSSCGRHCGWVTPVSPFLGGTLLSF